MAQIGYSPLPPNLSQEMANSIARMQGTAPEGLNAGNCANPRFSGSLGPGASSPPDPLAEVASLAGGGSADVASQAAGGGAAAGPAASAAGGASGKSGSGARAVGGGSTDWRDASPVAYTRSGLPGTSNLPLLAFVALIAVPPFVAGALRLRRRRREA